MRELSIGDKAVGPAGAFVGRATDDQMESRYDLGRIGKRSDYKLLKARERLQKLRI